MKSIEDIKLEKDAITGDAEAQYKLGVFYYICAYLMVAIVRKRLKIQKSLNEILQIVSVSIFEQIPLEQLLAPTTPLLRSNHRRRTISEPSPAELLIAGH